MSVSPGMARALAHCVEHRLTFAAFRTPGGTLQLRVQRTPMPGMVQAEQLDALRDAFLILPFLVDAEQLLFIRKDISLSNDPTAVELASLEECAGSPPDEGTPPADTTLEAFSAGIRAAQAAFAQGTLNKVVLSRTLSQPFMRERCVDLFVRAVAAMPHACVALVHAPLHGLWLGASPERLIEASGRHVRVDALAGTTATEQAPLEATDWGAKEQDEQAWVTQHVKDVFQRSGVHPIAVTGPKTVQAGPVTHLWTVLEGDLPEDTALSDLVLALHPTPAICGAPTEEACRFILNAEQHQRQLYSGAWGPWSTDGRSELFVNIRCMRLFAQTAQLIVGAGITAGSDATLEWAETGHKAATWLRLM